MADVEESQDTLYRIVNFTLQYLYSESCGWDWNHDDEVLNRYREVGNIIDNESIIPKSMYEKHPNIKPEKLSILCDFLRLGIILYQSNSLIHLTMNQTSRASNLDLFPPEITLLTTTMHHLDKLNQSMGNLNYINVLLSHLKFERFLVSFFLEHTPSALESFTGYQRGICSELDTMFYNQIKTILRAFQHISWHALTTQSHLRKVLLRVQATRELLISRVVKEFLLSNETRVFEALISYHELMEVIPSNLNQYFYRCCLKLSINPLSSRIDPSSPPEITIDKLNSLISQSITTNPAVSTEFITRNFLFQVPLSCNFSTEEAHKVVSKYAKSDTLNQSFSPEDDQGTSFSSLIDFLLQITADPDAVKSLLRLICSGRHPSLKNTKSQE